MSSRVKILCVDDDQEVLSVLTDILTWKGYEVATVGSGSAAVAQIGKRFDLIVVDYNLPDINGDIVAERWKREHPNVPILMMSGCPTLPSRALDFVNAHLTKGCEMNSLLGTVSELTKTYIDRNVVASAIGV